MGDVKARGHPADDVQPVSESHEVNSFYSQIAFLTGGSCGATILDMYSPEKILQIVRDPMNNSKDLRDLSNAIYSSNGIVTNCIDYCVSLPTLSRVVVPYGDSAAKKKKNKRIVSDVLECIKDKEIVRDGILTTLIDGVYFSYFEVVDRPLMKDKSMSDSDVSRIEEINEVNSGTNVAIITLDPDYTKIVGIKNGAYVCAFDLSYFDMSGMETAQSKLRKFPAEIRKGYELWKSGKGKQWLVLNNDHTIAIKFRAKKREPYGRPLVLAAIDDVMYDSYYTKSRRTALDDSNKRVYYETFPEGQKKGEAALTEKQQQVQHETVRDGLTKKNVNGSMTFFSLAAGSKLDSVKPNLEILSGADNSSTKNSISTSLGFAGSLLSGEGTSSFSAQTNNLELVTAEIFHVIELISYELNKCINRCIIKNSNYRTDVQYLPITYANRKEFAAMAKDLYCNGKGSLSLWASAVGINPDAFYSLLDEELENDVENKYPVHKSSFTQSSSGDTAGRPVDEDSTNPHTLETRANGSNDAPKPSV